MPFCPIERKSRLLKTSVSTYFSLSFFLILLARSNFDHYARECDFGILKKKKFLSAVFLTK